jgi:signal transduction histidine kinase
MAALELEITIPRSNPVLPSNGRVATAIGSTVELADLLNLVARTAVAATRADRASVFLLDGHHLHPAVAFARQPDDRECSRFYGFAPIELDERSWRLLLYGETIVIEDARHNDLVPDDWANELSLGSLVLVPMHAGGEPCGLIAVEWTDPAARAVGFEDVLRTMASSAGIAIANVRPFEAVARRARLQEALARGAAGLSSPLARDDVSDRLAQSYIDLLGARLCVVALADLERFRLTTVATRNTPDLGGTLPMADIPDRLIAQLAEAWAPAPHLTEIEDDPWLAEVLDAHQLGVSWYLAVPLLVHDLITGCVILGFAAEDDLDTEERAAAEALAALAAAALERQLLLERLEGRVRRLDVLQQASAALDEQADIATLVGTLNGLLSHHGIEVLGLSFRDRNLASYLGAEPPGPEERAAYSTSGCTELDDGTLLVPMRLGRRLAGWMRVRPNDLDREQRTFVEALAAGVAEAVSRSVLRAAVERAGREQAVSAERDRLAGDLHDTTGQRFVALGLLAHRLAEQLPPDSDLARQAMRLSSLADQGKAEIAQALRALAFLPARRGFVSSLRALAASTAQDSGIAVNVTVRGRPARLSPPSEHALYRVAHEALANAWRHAGCQTVNLEVRYEADATVLRVQDDGTGLRTPHRPGIGLTSMRRLVRDAGGTLRVTSVKPHGTRVEARMPKDRR